MRILVTGGTGVLGSAVCRELAAAGAEPVAFARRQPSRLARGVRFCRGDIRHPADVNRALVGCEAVVHLAWYVGIGAGVGEIESFNVGGTRTLLEAMARSGCRRLVFTSSTSAYGTSVDRRSPFVESDALEPGPTFVYATQKRDVEAMIAAADVDAVVARVAVVLGRHAANFATDQFAGPTILDLGGRSVLQAVHQEDVARFVAQVTVGSWSGTVNVAAPGSISFARAAPLLGRRLVGLPVGLVAGPSDVGRRLGIATMGADAIRTLAHWPVADVGRLQHELGFEPAWSQEDSVRDHGRRSARTFCLAPGLRHRPWPGRIPWVATTSTGTAGGDRPAPGTAAGADSGRRLALDLAGDMASAAADAVAQVRGGRVSVFRFVSLTRGYPAEVDRLVSEATALRRDDVDDLGDGALVAQIGLLHDLVCQAAATDAIGALILVDRLPRDRGPLDRDPTDGEGDRASAITHSREQVRRARAQLIDRFANAARARGRRLVDTGYLSSVDAVHDLTYDELLDLGSGRTKEPAR